jgi:hypothetical protein
MARRRFAAHREAESSGSVSEGGRGGGAIEGAHRDLNIALMNEAGPDADRMGIRTRDVLAAAGKWKT